MKRISDALANAEVIIETTERAPATQVFDNLAIIGTIGTSCLLFKTSEGLILLDALNPGEEFAKIIEDGMHELGYNPAEIKILLISHGHPDHTGCGRILIERYGCKPLLSRVDYDYEVEFFRNHPNPMWNFDYEINDFIEGGEVLRLGDTEIQVVSTPGHTPGGLSFFFDVYDQGRKYRAALWGGTAPADNIEDIKTYLKSFEMFAAMAREQHVEVNITNHPILDSGVDRMKVMKNRVIDEVPNPFIMGEEAYQRYIQVYRRWSEEKLESFVNQSKA